MPDYNQIVGAFQKGVSSELTPEQYRVIAAQLAGSQKDTSVLEGQEAQQARGAVSNPFALQLAQAQQAQASNQSYATDMQGIQPVAPPQLQYQETPGTQMPDVPTRPDAQVNPLAAILGGIAGFADRTHAGQYGAAPIEAAQAHADQVYKDELKKYQLVMDQALQKHQDAVNEQHRKDAVAQFNTTNMYKASLEDNQLRMEKAKARAMGVGSDAGVKALTAAGDESVTAQKSGAEAILTGEKIKRISATNKDLRAKSADMLKEASKLQSDKDSADADLTKQEALFTQQTKLEQMREKMRLKIEADKDKTRNRQIDAGVSNAKARIDAQVNRYASRLGTSKDPSVQIMLTRFRAVASNYNHAVQNQAAAIRNAQKRNPGEDVGNDPEVRDMNVALENAAQEYQLRDRELMDKVNQTAPAAPTTKGLPSLGGMGVKGPAQKPGYVIKNGPKGYGYYKQ